MAMEESLHRVSWFGCYNLRNPLFVSKVLSCQVFYIGSHPPLATQNMLDPVKTGGTA